MAISTCKTKQKTASFSARKQTVSPRPTSTMRSACALETSRFVRTENAGHQNRTLIAGSQWLERYHDVLLDGRFDWQRVFETEVGTTVQNNFETVTKHYVVDYLSVANRDILVTEDGSYTQTYVYDENSARISAEYSYAPGTARSEGGENLASDFADGSIEKIWYRRSLLDSSLFAVDEDGEVIAHMTYDAWGKPEKETYFGVNYAGIDNVNNYTGYTYDEVLDLYFAQNRFYDPQTKGFTQEDPIKDGLNWYSYVSNNPLVNVDPWGLWLVGDENLSQLGQAYTVYYGDKWLEASKLLNIATNEYERNQYQSLMMCYHTKANDIREKDKNEQLQGVIRDVGMYKQGDYDLCWAFSFLMVDAYNYNKSYTEEAAVNKAIALAKEYHKGRTEEENYKDIYGEEWWNAGGWPPHDSLKDISIDTMLAEIARGPFYAYYVGSAIPSRIEGENDDIPAHLIVVTGVVYADGHDALIYSNNPWGDKNLQTYTEFCREIPRDFFYDMSLRSIMRPKSSVVEMLS
jgi:RHS repeat-associated core domain